MKGTDDRKSDTEKIYIVLIYVGRHASESLTVLYPVGFYLLARKPCCLKENARCGSCFFPV